MDKNIFKQLNKEKSKFITLFSVGIFFLIISFLIFSFIPVAGIALFAFGVVPTIIAVAGLQAKATKLKTIIVNSIMSDHITNGIYRASPGVSSNIVYRSKVLSRASRFTSEDYIEGRINGVKFISSDVLLEDEDTSDGNHTSYTTVFEGQFYQFDFYKDFLGQIIITEDKMSTLFSSLKKIKLESIKFNKVFNVYTNNDHSAFYVLTPHFMERLLDLEKKYPGNISMSFIDDKFSIAIYNNADTFKIPVFRKFNEKLIDEFKKDLQLIKNIIESLNLDQTIYKGE